MNLISLSIKNYRSITDAHRIKFGRSTILIGPNNEGKSNIVRALVTALNASSQLERVAVLMQMKAKQARTHLDLPYEWERDFPVHLQKTDPNGHSVFTLEFQLTDEDIEAFWKEVQSNLNGSLVVEISLGNTTFGWKVRKKGPGGAALSGKREAISSFISKRINFQHIPAVRTAEIAQRIVEGMLSRELATLDGHPGVVKALEEISKIQKPILDQLSTNIKDTLAVFLPEVKDVKLQISKTARTSAVRQSCEVIVDDGNPTQLKYKGDGAQSLAALSLMRHTSERGAQGRTLLVAIEEPESHLHPNAVHQLKGVLQDLAKKYPLVITTHCPLFVDRAEIGNNIIVANNKAAPAKTIADIREVLGIRPADNLRHAELVLVVEGEDDRLVLGALLKHYSPELRKALDNGALAIDSLAGGSKLPYKLGELRSALCPAYCFLDFDATGIGSADQAKAQGLLIDSSLSFTRCAGMQESELEDIYDIPAYAGMIQANYGVDLQNPKFKGDQKWSIRMRDTFKAFAKQWDDFVLSRVKEDVARHIAAHPANALHAIKRNAFDVLLNALKTHLTQIPPKK